MKMAHTAEMFSKPRRLKRMHVIDSGEMHGERAARFYCEHCETTTGWMPSGLTEQRRGIPCPECNAVQPGEKP